MNSLVINGNSRNNSLTGGEGNDTINGGAGIDTLIGGAGDDIYIVDSSTDLLTEAAGAGTDTVKAKVSFSLAAIANVENITLTGSANIDGTANSLNNLLIGNSGNNSLSGGEGNDTIIGGAGNDSLDGGAGSDTLNGGNGDDVLLFEAERGFTKILGSDVFAFNSDGDFTASTGIQLNAVGGLYQGSLDTFNGGDGVDTVIEFHPARTLMMVPTTTQFTLLADVSNHPPFMAAKLVVGGKKLILVSSASTLLRRHSMPVPSAKFTSPHWLNIGLMSHGSMPSSLPNLLATSS
jgi:Ca2+-binding RTX toxin-like protein